MIDDILAFAATTMFLIALLTERSQLLIISVSAIIVYNSPDELGWYRGFSFPCLNLDVLCI